MAIKKTIGNKPARGIKKAPKTSKRKANAPMTVADKIWASPPRTARRALYILVANNVVSGDKAMQALKLAMSSDGRKNRPKF